MSDLPAVKNFGNLAEQFSSFEDSRALVIPVPYERSTTGGKGTAAGPEAIIRASDLIESYDEERNIELSDIRVATLPPTPVAGKDPQQMMELVGEDVESVLSAGKFPLVLGGEHTVTAGAVAAVSRYLGQKVTLVQLDAHADLRESYLGDPYNHGCAMRLCLPHVKELHQLGIRAISSDEYAFVCSSDKVFTSTFGGRRIDVVKRFRTLVEEVRPLTGPVYLSIDMDVFDPGAVPGVGTPEPGGLSWPQVTGLVQAVCETSTVVAADVVELMPVPGQYVSEVTAAKLVWRILSRKFY